MPDHAIAPRRIDAPSRPLRVSGKLRDALELMVDEGQPLHKAAQAVGMTTRNLRKAFERPHVLAFVRQRKHMLIASEVPRTIHRLVAIRDKAENMPAVNASRLLLELNEGDGRLGSNGIAQPHQGVTIVIQGAGPHDLGHGVMIEGKAQAIPDDSDGSALPASRGEKPR